MKIALGADHRGRDVLRMLWSDLSQADHDLADLSDTRAEACDYPDLAYAVACAVARREAERGILVCGTGIGMSIAANKVRGVRAAAVHDEIGADLSRRHNDANVLCLPADILGHRIIARIVKKWLAAPFEGGRHARRVAKITAIENGADPRQVVHTATEERYDDTVGETIVLD